MKYCEIEIQTDTSMATSTQDGEKDEENYFPGEFQDPYDTKFSLEETFKNIERMTKVQLQSSTSGNKNYQITKSSQSQKQIAITQSTSPHVIYKCPCKKLNFKSKTSFLKAIKEREIDREVRCPYCDSLILPQPIISSLDNTGPIR